MAKSKRSKVKMAHKAMRRRVLESKLDAQVREQAGKVYKAIGLDIPEERAEESKMQARYHGGFEIVSTFVPTPKAPKLNVVHGPLANKHLLQLPKEVVGFPLLGTATKARRMAQRNVAPKRMDIDQEEAEELANTPYFYPRRARQSGSIHKRRKDRPQRSVRKPRAVEIDASA